MKTIMEAFKEFCSSKGIRFEEMPEEPVLRIRIAGKNATFLTYITVDEEDRELSIRTISPVLVPKDRLPQILEVTALANGRARLGNFEVSFADGRTDFRTSVIFGQQDPDETIIDHLCHSNWASSDRYLPACCSVLFGSTSPQEAIRLVDADRDPVDTGTGSSTTTSSSAPNAGPRWGGRLGDVMGPSSN